MEALLFHFRPISVVILVAFDMSWKSRKFYPFSYFYSLKLITVDIQGLTVNSFKATQASTDLVLTISAKKCYR